VDPDRRRLEAILGLVLMALVLVTAAATTQLSTANHDLLDTDGYMRFLRIERLWETGGWFDGSSPRSNSPYGEYLHWTRPLDVVVSALAAPMLTVGATTLDALYRGAVLVGPFVLGLIGLALAWAISAFGKWQNRMLTVAAVVAAPALLAYSLPGRVDHHGLIALLFLLVVATLLRLVEPEGRGGSPALLGVLLALGTWVSTEFLIPMALANASLLLGWVASGDERWGRMGRVMASWQAGAIACFLVIERGLAGLAAVEYDRISLVHLGLSAVLLALWWGMTLVKADRPAGRAVVLAVAGLAAAALMRVMFPLFFGGPFAAVDPELQERWLSGVTEMQPLIPYGDGLSLFLVMLAVPVAFAPVAVWKAWRTRHPRWLLLAGWLVAYIGLAMWQLRFSTFAELLGLIVALLTLFGLVEARRGSGTGARLGRLALVGVAFALLLLAGPLLAGLGPSQDAAGSCPVTALSSDPAFASLGSGPLTIAADVDYGPELLFRTPHNVIATPYHRNADGILDTWDLLATRSEAEAEAMIRQRGIDLILLCPQADPGLRPSDPAGTLYEALETGHPPAWASPIPLSADGFLLYRIDLG
jgi:asparagine N-glycosylation enzyme membrane subunit Stt3